MASVVELKRKDGRVAYSLRYAKNGVKSSISFDSSYSREEVDEIARIIEKILLAEKKGEYLDRHSRMFIENAPYDLKRRFVKAGFSDAKKYVTINDAWAEFIAWKNSQVCASTQLIWKLIGDRLFALFDKDLEVNSITPSDAKHARETLAKDYSEATIATTIGRFRTFWSWTVEKSYADNNVFLGVRKGSDVNRSKDFQIPREWTERILEACPSQTWRTLFSFWRIGGLRQQEPLLIKWNHVDWERKRIVVPSPKTSRYEGREERVIPMFPSIEKELEESRKNAPRNEAYVIYENRRRGFDSGFKRILYWAGLDPWPKLFQNMRSSRENDLIEEGFPPHVVGAWIGHTSRVQERHYLRTLDSFFQRALDEKL